MEADSVHSIVTDPPYGLGFMGKKWDELPPGDEWARECLRVLKPGGYLLAFGGTRTWHRLAVAVEDAGFEIRDSIAWLYGSGFPKSMDVSKAIDKAAGAEREVVGTVKGKSGENLNQIVRTRGNDVPSAKGCGAYGQGAKQVTVDIPLTAAATDAAKQWEGWGTALKPAFEPVVVGRKPLATKTVAANVLEHGTGALNIDACRIGTQDALVRPDITRADNVVFGKGLGSGTQTEPAGRWPANVVLDEDQAVALDEQSGTSVSRARVKAGLIGHHTGGQGADSGGASRFFHTFKYQAKASKAERPNVAGVMHPTVKPVELMRWLVRLATPPEGIVLDPFAGSGTTAEACVIEGFDCIAIEREGEYLPLIAARLDRMPMQLREEPDA